MDAVLARALEAVARERGNFHDAFARVADLIAAFGEAGLANRVYTEAGPHTPWEDIADVLGIAIWSTSDNGSRLTIETDSWLREGEDRRKVLIAFNLDAIPLSGPDSNPGEREAVYASVSKKFPELAEKCGLYLTELARHAV